MSLVSLSLHTLISAHITDITLPRQLQSDGRWSTSSAETVKGRYETSVECDAGTFLVPLMRCCIISGLTCIHNQACHAAYDVTDETAVYACTGNPHPSDIEEIMKSMMNDSFETSYHRCVLSSSQLPADYPDEVIGNRYINAQS